MENRKLEIIQQLMEELQEEMQYGEDDLASRLGRKKPEMEVKIEAEPMGHEMAEGIGDDEEMEMEGPEDKLKSRLMKLRG